MMAENLTCANASGDGVAAEPRSIDLLVRHAHLLTMDDEDTVLPDGAVAVHERRIVAVGPDAEVARDFTAERVIDARGAPTHPGLIESHLHASYQLYRSAIPDDLPKADVFDTIERAFYDTVDDTDEHLAVLLSSLEMIRNGTTCFLEAGTVLEPEAAAAAAEQVGIRAVIADARVVDRPRGGGGGFIRRSPRNLQQALERLGRQAQLRSDPEALVTGHVAVHGLGTASEELLVEAKRRADAVHTVLNMHQSYSPEDTELDRARYGQDPVLRLAELGVLGPNVTLGHANYLTDAECDALLATATNIVWAPAASMSWGIGATLVSRHAELLRRGLNVALGSDSGNWSNDFDLFRQANLALLIAREVHRDRTILMAEDVLRMATRGGARAVGKEAQLGSIEVGKFADLVIHTLDRPELRPHTNMLRNLMYASRSKSVHTVIVNGRVILEAGAFIGLDEPALLAQIDAASRRLLDRMGLVVRPNRLSHRPNVTGRPNLPPR
jgi:5-methylthioadenosine/S-adenosylhomocysteine deaminase